MLFPHCQKNKQKNHKDEGRKIGDQRKNESREMEYWMRKGLSKEGHKSIVKSGVEGRGKVKLIEGCIKMKYENLLPHNQIINVTGGA